MLSRSLCLVVIMTLSLMWTSQAHSQDRELNWAEKMFSQLKIDFGTVARGADARILLVLTNLYEEDISIADVKTTCGCTAASPDRKHLKTHEKAHIEVKMDTVKFTHRKDSNVDVTLTFHGARGSATRSVRVPITAYIRTDVVLEPGNVNFGTVSAGAPSERKIHISYAGRPDWTIRDVQVNNNNLTAQVRELSRGNGRVNYELIVQLKEQAQVGNLQDQITLLTDDQNAPQVPVLVFGRVEEDLQVIPPMLALGNLQPGEVKEFRFIVRGKDKFAISSIEADSSRDWFQISHSPEQAKESHVIPFRITAPNEPGAFSETFTITIDGRSEVLNCKVQGNIVPAAAQE